MCRKLFFGKVDGMMLLTPVIIIIIIYAVTVVPDHSHIHATLANINEHTHIQHIIRPEKRTFYQRLRKYKCPSKIMRNISI